ncbi:hypothetical protein KAI11_03880 [Candidatus Bathyarchaeota archaeon]|nr:hypothetical protein [Candidatus Bathyarchaeota archaeon]
MGRRRENDCFGLPSGGAIFGLIIGVIIILVGLQQIFDWNIDISSYVIIIVGILVASGALFKLTRR